MDNENLIEIAQKMLSAYFDKPFSVTRLSMGNANANHVVVCDSAKYFFRIYLPVKDFPRKLEELETEIKITDWFSNKGFPVARVIKSLAGDTITCSDDYYGALFNFLAGQHAYGNLREIHFEAIGKLMAEVHTATEQNKLICEKRWEQGNFWLRIYTKVEKNKNILQIEDIKKKKKIETLADKLNKIPQYLIHGDYHFGNVLFDENAKISGLLDFDDYRMGHFMDDLVRSFVCELVYTPKEYYKLKQDYVHSFFRGYTEKRKISKEELELIPIYLDLHYLSSLIAVTKRTPQRVNEFKEDLAKLKNWIYNEISGN